MFAYLFIVQRAHKMPANTAAVPPPPPTNKKEHIFLKKGNKVQSLCHSLQKRALSRTAKNLSSDFMQENIGVQNSISERLYFVVVHFVPYYKKGRKNDLWSGIEKPQRAAKADFAQPK